MDAIRLRLPPLEGFLRKLSLQRSLSHSGTPFSTDNLRIFEHIFVKTLVEDLLGVFENRCFVMHPLRLEPLLVLV